MPTTNNQARQTVISERADVTAGAVVTVPTRNLPLAALSTPKHPRANGSHYPKHSP